MMKNSSSERKTKNTQDYQKLKFYQIQINLNINQCFLNSSDVEVDEMG